MRLFVLNMCSRSAIGICRRDFQNHRRFVGLHYCECRLDIPLVRTRVVQHPVQNPLASIETFTPANYRFRGETPQELEKDLLDCFQTNVVGNVHLFNLFIPLILRGRVKKVIAISTGFADSELTAKYDLEMGGPYSASKAALNLVVAKFSAEYREKGVLFLSVAPGVVDTGGIANSKPPPISLLSVRHVANVNSDPGTGAKDAGHGSKVHGLCSPLHRAHQRGRICQLRVIRDI